MTDQVAISIPRLRVNEGQAFTATAYFRTRSTAAAGTPTSVKYRVDCLTTQTELADWTSVTPSTSASIAITATHNAIQSDSNVTERKQLTVASDYGLATQAIESVTWEVLNLDSY